MKRCLPLLGLAFLAACQDLTEPAPAPLAKGTAAAAPNRPGTPIQGRYIITFAPGVEDVPGLAKRLADENGGRMHFIYRRALSGFAASLPEAAAEALRKNPRVARVEPDMVSRATAVTQTGATWGLDRIDQRALPLSGTYTYSQTGSGVNAYIVDSGINYSHEEYAGRTRFAFDAFGDGLEGNDCNGHGSHVAGTVGGTRSGVAKGATLHAVRVLDCNGSGSASGLIAAMDWLIANAQRPAVANLSLGFGGINSSVDDAVRRTITAGITVVIAAGNDALDSCYDTPARVQEAITVGASDRYDEAAYFSNYGPCIDLFAPGVDIRSAWYQLPNQYATISGTSMAAPHTAGVAALFLEANALATPQQVREKLYEATTKSIVRYAYSANNHLLNTAFTNLPVPNSAPSADFTFACTNLSCVFTDASTDADGQVVGWAWTLGDGSTSSLQSPSKTYAAAGTYSVTLTATDNAGATHTATRALTVTAPTNGGGSGGGTTPYSLSVIARTARGQLLADLSWTGASGTRVEVYGNGMIVATTDNDGFHTDVLPKNAAGTFAYKVCNSGTTTCSNEANR